LGARGARQRQRANALSTSHRTQQGSRSRKWAQELGALANSRRRSYVTGGEERLRIGMRTAYCNPLCTLPTRRDSQNGGHGAAAVVVDGGHGAATVVVVKKRGQLVAIGQLCRRRSSLSQC